ncbi:MAG: DUF454 domain-containing protein [Gammaproteobacteria bacterium]|nr:DUF454 domain-containing protein [Gammaproteobacteria bacterium]
MKPLYFSLGCLFFGLGAIGVVIPVLPTTPFMLLALWAFSKSSNRLHDWLYFHAFFGPPLQQWREYRVIPVMAKVIAITMMMISLGYLLFFSTTSIPVIIIIALFMLCGALFILTKPSNRP